MAEKRDKNRYTSPQELWEIQTRQFRKDILHNIYKKYFKLLLKDIFSPDFV